MFPSIEFKPILPPISVQTPEETCWGLRDQYCALVAFDVCGFVIRSQLRIELYVLSTKIETFECIREKKKAASNQLFQTRNYQQKMAAFATE